MRIPSAVFLALLASLMIGGCATDRIGGFEHVREGMTRDEVRALLGAPSSTFEREVDDDGVVIRLERWQYGDTPGTFVTGALWSEHPPDRVWAVFFDEAGCVSRVVEPDWNQAPPPSLVPEAIPPRSR